METTTSVTELIVREGDPSSDVAATIEGVAVPYGVTIDAGGIRESFAEAAFDPAEVVGKPLAWRHGEPIGFVRSAENTPEGLRFTAEIGNTTQGRDAATLTRLGGMGISVGFTNRSDAWNRARDAVTRVRAGLNEISLTHLPAYPVGVGSIREETIMPDTATETVEPDTASTTEQAPDYATREEVAALRDRLASVNSGTTERTAPDADEFLREFAGKILTRAWTDVTVKGTDSDIAEIPASVSASIASARVTVNAIGVSPLAAEGLTASWMLDDVDPTVGAQGTEKTEIPSGPASGEIVQAPVVTFAGGNDVSIQFMQRSSVWDYPRLMQRFAEQYARKTNASVAIEVVAEAANTIVLADSGLTAEVLGEKLGWAAGKIAAGTSRAPGVLVLAPNKFFQIAAVAGVGFPIAGGVVGNANLSSLSYSAFGLRVVCDPMLTWEGIATEGYLLDPESIGIKENPGAPLTMTANVPSKLGQDVAVYGYLAHKVLNPDGIVSIIATQAATQAAKK